MTKKELQYFANNMVEVLPHGSGIDGDWQWEVKKNEKVYFSNYYHCMGESGMYEDYADFSLVVDPQDVRDFKIRFTGRVSHYLNNKHDLRDYFEDLFGSFFDSLDNLFSFRS